MTRRAAVWHGPEDVRVERRPVQQLGDHDVRIRIRAAGVCGSDVNSFYKRGPAVATRAPFIMGHEASGVVVECGENARRLQVGDRVAIEPGVPCGRCHQCQRGTYNLCPDIVFFADPPVDGAFTEQVVINAHFAYAVSDKLSDDAAALIEPAACAVAACWRAGITAGSDVLVTGAGPVGLLTARVARLLGAGTISVSDINPQRLAVAANDGADRILDARRTPLASGVGSPDVLIECTGVPSVVTEAVGLLAPRGRAVLVGMGLGDHLSIPVRALQRREVSITGAFRYANAYPAALALARRLDLDSLVSHEYSLDDTAVALKAMREDPTCVKAVLHP